MKKILLLMILLLAFPCLASRTNVGSVQGDILHTIQSPWLIIEEENSADTQTDALAETERTKKIVDALIVANAATEAYISVYKVPSKWNAIRLRAIGITDGGTFTNQIYLGSLGNETDCELAYAGQLAWVTGTQTSIYDQITFTSGAYAPAPGDIVTGNTSGKTAIVVSVTDPATGTWAAGTATGTVTYKSANGAFTNSETITITRKNVVKSIDAYTHAASDLLAFELADTLTVTAGGWGTTWTATSPVDNTNAEAELDIKGADYMVIVTTACSADGKLLIKGY